MRHLISFRYGGQTCIAVHIVLQTLQNHSNTLLSYGIVLKGLFSDDNIQAN